MGVKLFEDLISDAWRLERVGSYWSVEEHAENSNNKKVLIGGCSAIAFSLDRGGVDPIPFIRENCPLPGIRSVCDAMIVLNHEGKTYFCAMDLKSNKEGGASKQIEIARLLFQWLLSLACFNKHWPTEKFEDCFFGVINFAPRQQVRKGVTQRSAEIPEPEKSAHGDYKIFRLRNHPRIPLPLLINRLG
ncbi:hypothetical protein [Burkholderia sp. AU4i]|uniref:hypothetical protein n=1 Tax=Burkholderia sp. AU4i TaxID=1335308 RepID=UPI0012DF961E|nr:hypothetical protein [Burkholderia sp. AU4i]